MADDLHPRAAERLVRAARAAHTLSEVLWEALHEQLASPQDGERVAALSRRLSDVAATVTLLAGEHTSSAEPAVTMPTAEPETAPGAAGAEVMREQTSPLRSAPQTPEAPRAQAPPPVTATLIDELAPVERPTGETPRETPKIAETPRITETQKLAETPRIAETPKIAEVPRAGEREEIPEIEVRDQRAEHAPSAWIAAIERRLERHRHDRKPFAVMVIELVDIERLRHAELPGALVRLTGVVETALASELRPADSLMRESPGRYWLLAPETDPDDARTLATRLDAAVAGADSHRGAPLQVAIGIATCPADGLVAGALAAHADVALYAARAAGRPLA